MTTVEPWPVSNAEVADAIRCVKVWPHGPCPELLAEWWLVVARALRENGGHGERMLQEPK